MAEASQIWLSSVENARSLHWQYTGAKLRSWCLQGKLAGRRPVKPGQRLSLQQVRRQYFRYTLRVRQPDCKEVVAAIFVLQSRQEEFW